MGKNKTKKKKILKIIAIPLAIILLVVVLAVSYFLYVLIAFHRIGDMPLTVENTEASESMSITTGTEYKIFSWNIGFGAYEDDYGFFMDGGTESWAWSEERLDKNLKQIGSESSAQNADIYIFQEVDFDATRSYHFDERIYLSESLPVYQSSFCQNYDSPFLFYPFTQPHGANKSGIMTFSRFDISSAERKELPIETSLSKLVDLDRCYSVNRIPTANGKELVVYNFHLSAYTSDPTTSVNQLILLLDDMKSEYEKGNYCIAGGDFNKDLLGNSKLYFECDDEGEYNWAQPIPEGVLEAYEGINLVVPYNESDHVASCRNADSAYHEGQYLLVIDGFIVSDNVEVVSHEVVDMEFKYSDHNPVSMIFKLAE